MIRPSTKPFVRKILGRESGFLLIAALTLLGSLLLIGVTAYTLTSTGIKIARNFRNSQMALEVATAGAEHARQVLRELNALSDDTARFSEELLTRVGPNDTLNGYTTATNTDDIPLILPTSVNMNNNAYSYKAYLTNDTTDGASNTTDSNGRAVITSVATGLYNSNTGTYNSKAIVQIVVATYAATGSPATIYSKDNVVLNGGMSISGINATPTCGGGNLAPVYTKDPSTTTEHGQPKLTGSPATPIHGPSDIDIQSYIDALKGGASYTLTNDVTNGSYGNSSNFVTVYGDAVGTQADGELRLNNVTGYGALLIKGNLQLAGNFEWHGIILVTGVVSVSGGGGDTKNIQGQIIAGLNNLGGTNVSGSITIGYNSCNVNKALVWAPLRVVNWKQVPDSELPGS